MAVKKKTFLFGPFDHLVTMDGLPDKGPIPDKNMQVLKEAGILVQEGKILSVKPYSDLKQEKAHKISFQRPISALPSFIDAHTHICFAGSRLNDFQKKLQGISYAEIAKEGGGIFETVRETRKTSKKTLLENLLHRLSTKLRAGFSTVEIKSGYGLDFDTEIALLETIRSARKKQPLTLIPTLLAAHTLPPEFPTNKHYLEWILATLIPEVKKRKLTDRCDIFCDRAAFTKEESKNFLKKAKEEGFTILLHGDQFSKGGTLVAASLKALSADHLEVSQEKECALLKKSGTIPIVLPGASLGLGLPFAKARLMLDVGLPLVIASDWNPGSAPSGDLLMQASLLALYEKLSIAETFSGITFRAARALKLHDRGILKEGYRADFSLFPTNDYREILYRQGALKPDFSVLQGKVYTFEEKVYV